MASCPNCGRTTERTQDWACQWCGYPLVSGSFRQSSKTYEEGKTERLQKMSTAEVMEVDIQGEKMLVETPEVTVGDVEETVEPEVSEAEMVVEAEPAVEVALEIEPEPPIEMKHVVEEESASEEGNITEESIEADETNRPMAEDETSDAISIIPVTIDELNDVCKADSGAAEFRFARSILQITAEIGRIPQVESSENPCIILIDSEKPTAMNVLCIFDKQYEDTIKGLSEGQLATVQGRYDGCVMNILLNDCVLID